MEKIKKHSSLIGAVVVLIIVIYAVFSWQKSMVPKEPIKIGYIGMLTGPGEIVKNATQLAIDKINLSGGVNGRLIEVIFEDGKCSGVDAVTAARKLVDIDKVGVILGGLCSSETLAFSPITNEAKVLAISPTSGELSVINVDDFVFRNMLSDAEWGQVLANIVVKDHKKVAIISEQSEGAQGLKKNFVKGFEALGGKIVADENFAPGTKDFKSMLLKIKSSGYDAILVNPQVPLSGGLIIKQLGELKISAPLYGNMVLAGSEGLDIAGAYAENMILLDAPGLSPDNQVAANFLSDYEQKYGKPTFEFYLGAYYDAVNIMAQAMSDVGTDSQKIKDYLSNLRDYKGVIGTYGFDQYGNINGIQYSEKIVKDGKAVNK